jgi:hypothetical protein
MVDKELLDLIGRAIFSERERRLLAHEDPNLVQNWYL